MTIPPFPYVGPNLLNVLVNGELIPSLYYFIEFTTAISVCFRGVRNGGTRNHGPDLDQVFKIEQLDLLHTHCLVWAAESTVRTSDQRPHFLNVIVMDSFFSTAEIGELDCNETIFDFLHI